ncbi:Deuterolysin metalloprotease family-domain-containing protein [Fusarium redolens]|uniref:Neutral protease 2 n=1 Tax=Fusarium redolens TaxID=48865 RepID=A0A9P9KME6_FUSRE|nr:Deuterolysin metalloprotease family-domain-containing protein [Fusarium redolens]KAH7258839.1 Deuterolysin metalloprotease family-domain-containing protein [Fusarium redolens]
MRFSPILALVACLAPTVQAHLPRYKHARNSDALTVSLEPVLGQSTQVNVSIKNDAGSDLSLLKIGTILDERPVKKLSLKDESGNEVPFMGIELSLYYDGLKTNHFEKLRTGSSIFRIVDLSTMYDLKPGTYSVYAEGSLTVVSKESGKPTPAALKSEAIHIKINNASSAESKQKASKRTILQEDSCTAEKLELTANSVKNCETLARAAAKDASDVHSARFVEYFKSNETKAREHVTGRLLAVAEECSTSDSGNTRVFCRDEIGYCETDGPLIAYTTWVNGYVTMCPLFYDTLPPLPQKCHKQDHATTTIHEMTHARAVYEQEVSTQDYAYGYENSTALDPLSCLYNADSYSLYANAVYLDC